MRRVMLVVIGLAAIPAAIQAQVCTGQAPWSSGPVKLGGGLEIGDGYTDFFGGVGFGRDGGLFAGAGLGLTDYAGGSQIFLSGGLGKELDLSGPVELCPVAAVTLGLPDNDYTYQTVVGGLAAGYPVPNNSENVDVVVTGSLQLGFLRQNEPPFGSDTDFLGILDGGVGVIFTNRISLLPRVRVYFGGGSSDAALLIGANVAVRSGS